MAAKSLSCELADDSSRDSIPSRPRCSPSVDRRDSPASMTTSRIAGLTWGSGHPCDVHHGELELHTALCPSFYACDTT